MLFESSDKASRQSGQLGRYSIQLKDGEHYSLEVHSEFGWMQPREVSLDGAARTYTVR